MYWLEEYHADGLRVDAVANMLYLDYSRQPGQWIPNKYGGRENLEAIDFLRQFNSAVYARQPHVQTIAEESTAWPMVSRPAHVGGLGFGLKWDMGWMHDTLAYMSQDPVHRKYHHGRLTFRMVYAFHENFVLPLSHDEVVHGKGSLLSKMPGDEWQKFANLRLLLAYMFGSPGKKLLFMGTELAPWDEWHHDAELPWHLLDDPQRRAFERWLTALNVAYRTRAGASRAGLRSAWLRMDRHERRRSQRDQFSAQVAGGARANRRRLQLHAGAAIQLSRRRATRRLLARATQQRRQRTRRLRAWKPRRRRSLAGSVSWANAFADAHAPAVGRSLLEIRRLIPTT